MMHLHSLKADRVDLTNPTHPRSPTKSLWTRWHRWIRWNPGERRGYIFLISVLFIGVIGIATGLSLLLLAWAAEQNGQTYAQSTQALEMARSCSDFAIQSLREDTTYAGGDTINFGGGTYCTVLAIQGSGNQRTLCTEGISGVAKKRVVTVLEQMFPDILFRSYEESTDVDLCHPADFLLCGNGNVDPGEQCDDGGTDDDDGCSASCTIESDCQCSGDPSMCVCTDIQL